MMPTIDGRPSVQRRTRALPPGCDQIPIMRRRPQLLSRAICAAGQQRVPVEHGLRDVDHAPVLERAWSRSSSNARALVEPWRSIRMPLARSITARRSSAVSSWSTFSVSCAALAVARASRPRSRPGRLRRRPTRRRRRSPCSAARATNVGVALAHLRDHRARRRTRPPRAISASACSSSSWTTTIARSGSSRAISSAASRDRDGERRDLVPELLEHVAERVAAPPRPRRRAGPAGSSHRCCVVIVQATLLYTRSPRPRPPPRPTSRAPATSARSSYRRIEQGV